MRTRWRSAAWSDLTEHALYLSERSESAAKRFIEGVEETCRYVTNSPEIGEATERKIPGHIGLRVWPVRGFRNYLLFYFVHVDEIEIARILHGSSDWEQSLL